MHFISFLVWWFFVCMRYEGGRLWRFWAKALGEKSENSDTEANYITLIRTFLIVITLITNIFIICGVIRHWK